MISRTSLMMVVLLCSTVAAVHADDESAVHFEAEWNRQLRVQLHAVQAEVRLRENGLAATEELLEQGAVTAEVLRQSRTCAVQAAAWADVVTKISRRFRELPESSAGSGGVVQLRVPGVPLALVDDAVASVTVQDSPQAREALQQIAGLLKQQRALMDEMTKPPVMVMSVADIRRSGERLVQPEPVAAFDPMRLEATLLTPARRCAAWPTESFPEVRSPTSWTLAAREWVQASRRLLIEQAHHLPLESAADEATAVDAEEVGNRRSVIEGLERELTLAGFQESNEETARTTRAHRLGLFMQIAKDAYDAVQQDMVTVREDIRAIESDLEQLSEQSGRDAVAVGIQSRRKEQLVLAAAVEQQLKGELARRRSLIRYAMALYRLETGKDTDSVHVHQERLQLFRRACELEPEVNVLALELEMGRQRLDRLNELPSQTAAIDEERRQLLTGLTMLETEQRRTEIRISIARLCLQLYLLSKAEPALALQ